MVFVTFEASFCHKNFFFTLRIIPHVHQTKVLIYPLNENFLSLQVATLRSQLIFLFLGRLFFLS
ncbi:hypothetical protein COE30_15270 [Bacillus cereus]|nr:hypothetical protein COE30_15270 [Bacillus cereus]